MPKDKFYLIFKKGKKEVKWYIDKIEELSPYQIWVLWQEAAHRLKLPQPKKYE